MCAWAMVAVGSSPVTVQTLCSSGCAGHWASRGTHGVVRHRVHRALDYFRVCRDGSVDPLTPWVAGLKVSTDDSVKEPARSQQPPGTRHPLSATGFRTRLTRQAVAAPSPGTPQRPAYAQPAAAKAAG